VDLAGEGNQGSTTGCEQAVPFRPRATMLKSPDLSRSKLVLLATGAVSVFVGLWHFASRAELVADPAMRAARDLNGLSMLFAGLVTVCVAWMAVSPELVTGYAVLYGIYAAAYAWVLLFARISFGQAAMMAVLATAALFAAVNAWSERHREDEQV
jgi:hypothetical protein